jgi:hypothetical protein
MTPGTPAVGDNPGVETICPDPHRAWGPLRDVNSRGDRATARLPHIQDREFQPCNVGGTGARWRCEPSAPREPQNVSEPSPQREPSRSERAIQVRANSTATKRTMSPKRDKLDDDDVTTNTLATHLGCTRQNIARLVAEAIIEQRSDGCFDQTASRLKYIKHLREMQRCSPRVGRGSRAVL